MSDQHYTRSIFNKLFSLRWKHKAKYKLWLNQGKSLVCMPICMLLISTNYNMEHIQCLVPSALLFRKQNRSLPLLFFSLINSLAKLSNGRSEHMEIWQEKSEPQLELWVKWYNIFKSRFIFHVRFPIAFWILAVFAAATASFTVNQ